MQKKVMNAVSRGCTVSGLVLLGLSITGFGSRAVAGVVPIEIAIPGPCATKQTNGDCGKTCPAATPNCNITRTNTCKCKA